MKKVILENNEDIVINNLTKNFKKEESFKNKINPSVIAENEEEVISEGLKFFKASPRLYKLALKIERKSKQNPSLEETVKKINALANKFEFVEDLYEVGRKAEAKAQYKQLCDNYNDVLKLLRNQTTKDGLKKVGLLALTVASMTVPYLAMQRFFPSLNFSAVSQAAEKTTGLKRAELYLKRAGAFTLCGLPVKVARDMFNYGTDAAELKVLKSVDRLLSSKSVDYSEYEDDELHQLA